MHLSVMKFRITLISTWMLKKRERKRQTWFCSKGDDEEQLQPHIPSVSEVDKILKEYKRIKKSEI